MIEESRVNRINKRINLVAVFLGLIVSIIILFIGAIYFYGLYLSSPNLESITLFIGTVLLAMAFFGSIISGILGGEDFNDGAINGAFLSLVIVVFVCFTIGIIFFVLMGIAGAFTSALLVHFIQQQQQFQQHQAQELTTLQFKMLRNSLYSLLDFSLQVC